MLQVYTGDGKGKTTAALGLCLRAVGHNFKVAVVQFLKDDPEYGEFKAKELLPNFELYQVGRNDFVNFKNPDQIDLDLADKGWEKAKKMLLSGKYDIIVLDEFTLVLKYNLIETTAFYQLLDKFSGKTEIVVTGRYAPVELIERADLVTEMTNIKHYFDSGVESRIGIDH